MTTGLRPWRVIYKFPLSSPTSLLSPNSNSSCRPCPSRLPLSGERLVSWSCWVQGECYLAVLMRSEPRAASWHRDGVSRERLGWGVSGLGKLAIRGGATILSCCRPLTPWDRGHQVGPASHHVLVLLLGLLNDLQGTEKVHSATVRSLPGPQVHHCEAL